MPPDRSSSSARPAVPFDRDSRRWHPTLQTTTKKTTVCCASLLTLWLARPPFSFPPSKERWAVQTPPSLPGARFPALPDKESASRRTNGRPETLEPRLGAPPLPIAASGRKPDLVRFFCQPTAPCTRQLAVDSHALCCRRLQRGVCCVGPLATGSKRLLAS